MYVEADVSPERVISTPYVQDVKRRPDAQKAAHDAAIVAEIAGKAMDAVEAGMSDSTRIRIMLVQHLIWYFDSVN